MKNKQVELENKIEFYNIRISSNPNDDNAYNLKGKAYIELAQQTNDQKFYNNAIESFSKAIAINPDNRAYVCDRAKIYAQIGNSEKAIEDFRKVNKLPKNEDVLENSYVHNILQDIAKLDNIKSTIQNLRKNNELPEEFLNAFDALTNVATTLCVTVADHATQLKEIWNVIDIINKKLSENKEITDHDFKTIQEILDCVISEVKNHGDDINLIKDIAMAANLSKEKKSEPISQIHVKPEEPKHSSQTKASVREQPLSNLETPLLSQKQKEQEIKPEASYSECCVIFSLTRMEYNNPILNHPEILQSLTDGLSGSLSFWEVIDKVSSFDKEFVNEVCLSGNIELIIGMV